MSKYVVDLILFRLHICLEKGIEFTKLSVVKLDKVVSDSGKVVVKVRSELSKSSIIATLLSLLHLDEVGLHAVDLILAQLSQEVGNLGKHLFLFDLGLGKHELILVFFAEVLRQLVGDYANILLVELGKEVSNSGEVLIES